MTFDPDKFIAQRQQPSFDPDAFINSKTEQLAPQAPEPEQEAQNNPDESLARDAYNTLAEFASSTNRSILGALDFLTVDNVNAGLNLAGSDARIPTLTETFGNEGGFMDEGLARDVVRGVGGLVPAVAGAVPAVGRNVATARGATEEILGLGAAKTSEIAAPATKMVKNVAASVGDKMPSKAKDAAKLPLLRQSGDVSAAGFKLDDKARVVKDAAQQRALKLGVDKGTVAMISASNKATKKRYGEVLDVLEGGLKNKKYRDYNNPQRVIGQALEDRLLIIQKTNKEAANNLDRVAKNLTDEPVDVSQPVREFINDLESEGITVRAGRLDFNDSSIEGLKEPQAIINNVFRRLYYTNDPTKSAIRVHNAKKFIDNQVTYGKTQSGLSGRMEGIAKKLRRGLDSTLDKNFPEYDRVNTAYSETRSVIDDVQSLAGKKVNLTDDKVDKALGTMSRKVLSNYNTGTLTETLFEDLDRVAARYSTPLSADIDDDLKALVSLQSEIRRMFPTAVKSNSLQGNVGMETARIGADVASGGNVEALKKIGDKIASKFSRSEEEQIQALRDLLTE